MKTLHIAQIGLITPLLNRLQESGESIHGLIGSSGLIGYDLLGNDNYIPVKLLYALLTCIQQKAGVDNFWTEFNGDIKLASLSQAGENLAYTPDVLSACKLVSESNHLIISSERASLEINGPITTLKFQMIDSPALGREKMEQISFALALNAIRLAAGEDWMPQSVSFQHNFENQLDAILPSNSNIKVYHNQAEMALTFATSTLFLPMLGGDISTQGEDRDSIVEDSLVQKMNRVLESDFNPGHMNLNYFSEMAAISPSSFKRQLAAEGSTFHQCLDNWRFKTSIEKMNNPSFAIKEISERLGYSNQSNFNRAFKRWTNVSPTQYQSLRPC